MFCIKHKVHYTPAKQTGIGPSVCPSVYKIVVSVKVLAGVLSHMIVINWYTLDHSFNSIYI